MSVTWDSPCNFVVTLFGDLSQCRSHDDSTMESPHDNHLRITRWFLCNITWEFSHIDFSMESPHDVYLRVKRRRMKDITLLFIVVTATLMTWKWCHTDWLCCSDRILFTAPDVYITSFWVLINDKISILCLLFFIFSAPVIVAFTVLFQGHLKRTLKFHNFYIAYKDLRWASYVHFYCSSYILPLVMFIFVYFKSSLTNSKNNCFNRNCLTISFQHVDSSGLWPNRCNVC